MYELVRKAVQQKTEYAHDHRIVLPDGIVKHIHAIGHPLLDAAGEVVEYIGTSMDVTELKHAEQARRELEEQWRAAFESNPTMYFIVDAAGAIASVNAFGAEQLGYSVSELVGQPVLSVFYEPDRDAVQNHAKECF
jgi:PAS domain-containing protein